MRNFIRKWLGIDKLETDQDRLLKYTFATIESWDESLMKYNNRIASTEIRLNTLETIVRVPTAVQLAQAKSGLDIIVKFLNELNERV